VRFPAPAGEQSTEAHQQQTRLALANVPQNAHGVVARILSQGTPGRVIQQVDQADIVRLLKMVQRFAQQQMGIQLTAEREQFRTLFLIQDGFCHTQRAAKTGDDAADGGDLHLSGSVANEVNLSRAKFAAHRNPAPI
jgi:hypothetical protein